MGLCVCVCAYIFCNQFMSIHHILFISNYISFVIHIYLSICICVCVCLFLCMCVCGAASSYLSLKIIHFITILFSRYPNVYMPILLAAEIDVTGNTFLRCVNTNLT